VDDLSTAPAWRQPLRRLANGREVVSGTKKREIGDIKAQDILFPAARDTRKISAFRLRNHLWPSGPVFPACRKAKKRFPLFSGML
jgi:hypothetical protein